MFWGDMTPALFRKYTSAHDRRMQEQDGLNHMLGNYIGIAVNNPKEYPKKPYLSVETDKPQQKNMSDEAMEREAKRIVKMFGGEIK